MTSETLSAASEVRPRMRTLAAELDGNVVAADREQRFDRARWERCATAGLLAHPLPVTWGGSGLDLLTTVQAFEAFAVACADNGLPFAIGGQLWACAMPVLTFGSDEQRHRYLPRMAAGELIAAHAASEPEAGSDVLSMQARAVRDGDRYVLHGHKSYVTNAPVADVLLVLANVDDGGARSGITAFLVDRDRPGLRVSEPIAKMGMRTAAMGEVELSGCEVPLAARLGEEGAGSAIFGHAMEYERAFIMAPALGAMQRLTARTLARVRERTQFGRPLSEFQAVSHQLAEMHRAVETSRALLYRVAARRDRGERLGGDSALVKLHLSESWVAVASTALQLHGALGYLTETEIERDVRDALGSRIYSGTSEIQRELIARYLGA
jgi:alkylation response protein AidB-like acyl-CoA dehydrogenase